MHVRKLFAHLVCDFAEVYEIVGHINQLRRGVGAKARDFDAAAFVGDGVDGIDEIFVAGDEHGGIVASGQAQHVNGDFDIEVGFACAVVKSFQFFLDDAKTVAAHPEQETLLAFRPDIHARIEEGSEQSSVAEQHAQWWSPFAFDLPAGNVIVQPENRGTASDLAAVSCSYDRVFAMASFSSEPRGLCLAFSLRLLSLLPVNSFHLTTLDPCRAH